MSIGRKLWHWCRFPKEPKRVSHTRLFVGALCTLFGIGLFVSLMSTYNIGPMIEHLGRHATTGSTIPVVTGENLGLFFENVTLQSVVEANNSTVPDYNLWLKSLNGNDSEVLKVLGAAAAGSGNLGNMNLTIANFGDNDLHAVGIKIYGDNTLLASKPVVFTIPANSVVTINFDLQNLEQLSVIQAQQLSQIDNGQQGSDETLPYVSYTFKLETREGVTLIDDHFTFPTYPMVFFQVNSDYSARLRNYSFLVEG